jgi:hypothetical protein
MAHTHNQDFDSCILSLDTTHNQTKNDIKGLTYNISTLNSKFETLSKEVKNLTSLSGCEKLDTMMSQFWGPTSYEQPSHQEGTDSSHSMAFHSNPLHHELHLPKVEVNKFDGSDPTGWVTQMEYYFSLHGIIDDLTKLHIGVLYLDLEMAMVEMV